MGLWNNTSPRYFKDSVHIYDALDLKDMVKKALLYDFVRLDNYSLIILPLILLNLMKRENLSWK